MSATEPGGSMPVAATEAGERILEALARTTRMAAADLASTNDALQTVYDLYDRERGTAELLTLELADARRLYHLASLELEAIRNESALGLFIRKLMKKMPVPNSRPLFSHSRITERLPQRSSARLRLPLLPALPLPRIRLPGRAAFGAALMGSGQTALRTYRSLRMPAAVTPRITIVTPASDVPGALDVTMRSIVAQRYANVQHVVAGDAAVEERPDGEIVGFIRAGDVLEAGALERIGRYFAANADHDVIYYDTIVERDGARFAGDVQPGRVDARSIERGYRLPESSVFFRRSFYEAGGAPIAGVAERDANDVWMEFARRRTLVRAPGHVTSTADVPAAASRMLTAEEPLVCPITGAYPDRLLVTASDGTTIYEVGATHLAVIDRRGAGAPGSVTPHAIRRPLDALERLVYGHHAAAEAAEDGDAAALDLTLDRLYDASAGPSVLNVGHADVEAWSRIPMAQRFDRIRLTDPIESFADPLATLIALRMLLAPGGQLVLSLANFDSAQRDMFGPDWFGWHTAGARFVFGTRSFKRLIANADMRATALRTLSLPRYTLASLSAGAATATPAQRLHAQGICNWSKIAFDPFGRGDVIVAALAWVG